MAPIRLAVGLVGPGLVGTAVLRQLAAQAAAIADRRGVELAVMAVASSSRMLLSAVPLDCAGADWRARLQHSDAQSTDVGALLRHLLAVSGPRMCAIIDCTASSELPLQYPSWLGAGVHIVTPNKKGFSSDLALFHRVKSERGGALCYHEATVGAGLPVLGPLQDMIDSGDRIETIEGILSGTLSYIFNVLSTTAGPSAKRFSDVVLEARANGYTEPDPRDDLNGMDFARKLVILSRIAGHAADLSTTRIESLVPEQLRDVSADEFMARLKEADEHYEKLNQEAFAKGHVLRYVGRVMADGKASVGLSSYPFTHPFASLGASDNIVSFTTARYNSPLVVRGAGAGAEVTAMGVMSDLLRVADAVYVKNAQ